MTRLHIDPAKDFGVTGIVMPQFCRPFCRFTVGDAWIGSTTGGEHMRVVLIDNIGVGTV